ncbi:MAG: alkaline phosphatase [Oligoflexales bacterium]
MKRRTFLASGVLGLPGLMLTRNLIAKAWDQTEDLGVASGEPTASSVVIWTCVPAQFGSAQGARSLEVTWEVALSQDFRDIVASGVLTASEASDYTVKTQVEGLQPYTRYYYRFATTTGYKSVVGITQTMPDNDTMIDKLRFASVSCQDFTLGYFTVFQAILNDQVDFVVHLGDAIYEKSGAAYQGGAVRTDKIGGGKATTLEHYRQKYRLYLTDPYYKELRRTVPIICLSDDHEVFNNWGGGTLDSAGSARKIAGLRAFHEFMPSPFAPSTDATPTKVFRKLSAGSLVDFVITDQRQYRNGPCKLASLPPCTRDSGDHTMLGTAQRDWFFNTLGESTARWRILLSGLVTTPIGLTLPFGLNSKALGVFSKPEESFAGVYFNTDSWDGYRHERKAICDFVADNNIKNLIISSGDIHNYYAGDLLRDESKGEKIATEFVTASITSNGISDLVGHDLNAILSPVLLKVNPHLKFCNVTRHGYTRFEVSEAGVDVSFVAVDTIKKPTASAGSIANFKVLPD